MTTVEPGLTVKSLAEVAWLVSRVGRQMIETQTEPSPAALRDFWQNCRSLQRGWDEILDDEPFSTPARVARFEETAAQLFATELLVRVWATILGGIDRRTGRLDLTRIATNTVSGLLQVRHRVLTHLLSPSTPTGAWAADLDRLRRRCDRWTDLLIGNLAAGDDLFQFAFDPDRARDFAVEAREHDSNSHPLELLIAAGVRLSFLGQLPEVPLHSPAFEGMIQSIVGCIPGEAFHLDGSLRAQLLPGCEPRDSDATDPTDDDSSQDVLLPGISLATLRRRFP
jgi:hypothetical protein